MRPPIYFSLAVALSLSSFAQIAPTEANLRNAVATGGLVQFSSPGLISLTAPITITNNMVIDGTANPVVFDGQGSNIIFKVSSGVHLSLTNITFANGTALGAPSESPVIPPAPTGGGAIQNAGGVIVAVNCTFTNNSAIGASGLIFGAISGTGGSVYGGAIWQTAGSIEIQGARFMNNHVLGGDTGGDTKAYGGAIEIDGGTASISGTSFSHNSAKGCNAVGGPSASADASGGAIFHQGSQLNITRSQFDGNSATGVVHTANGGAISVNGGSAAITNSYFNLNVVQGGDAGLSPFGNGYSGDGASIFCAAGTTVNISGSTFQSGSAIGGRILQPRTNPGLGRGGAIMNSGSASVVNSTITGNSSSSYSPFVATPGGAIYSDGSLGLTNVTVVANTSLQPVLYSAAGSFTLKNSLFGSNSGVTATNVLDAGNNLSATDSPTLTQSSSHNNLDLRLGPLGDYGGDTPTIRLLAGSPAIDAADDSAAPPTDQRGRTRPYGLHADVGAFESSAPFMIFGSVRGYLDPSATVTAGASSTNVDAAGHFVLSANAGSTTLNFSGTNSIFRPASTTLNLNVDTDLQTDAFEKHGLAYDPSAESPTFSFAGLISETWRFEVSTDLVNWTSVHTNTFSADGIYSMPLTNVDSLVFMKGIKQ